MQDDAHPATCQNYSQKEQKKVPQMPVIHPIGKHENTHAYTHTRTLSRSHTNACKYATFKTGRACEVVKWDCSWRSFFKQGGWNRTPFSSTHIHTHTHTHTHKTHTQNTHYHSLKSDTIPPTLKDLTSNYPNTPNPNITYSRHDFIQGRNPLWGDGEERRKILAVRREKWEENSSVGEWREEGKQPQKGTGELRRSYNREAEDKEKVPEGEWGVGKKSQ